MPEATATPWRPQGIVYPGKLTTERPIQFEEAPPPAALAPYVQCFWRMDWQLDGELDTQIVPSGCVNLVFECGSPDVIPAKVVGVRLVAHDRRLHGTASLVGVRFTPGGFYPFLGRSVSTLNNLAVPLEQLWGHRGQALTASVFGTECFDSHVAAMRDFLLKAAPDAEPEELRWISRIVSLISQEETLVGTRQILEYFPSSESKLQRTFKRWVGITPKRFIRTRRFQSAARRLLSGEKIEWSTLAQELGYYDQAHFINDFKSITGQVPSELCEK